MVGVEFLEQPVVVRDGDHAQTGLGGGGLHPAGAVPQGIDVEAGIEFVEDGEARLEHGELESLVALLLAAGQIDVHRTFEEPLVKADPTGLGAHERIQTFHRSAASDERLGENGVEADAGNFARVLHHQMKTSHGPLVGGQTEDLFAVEGDAAAEHLVAGLAHDDGRERGLPGAVRAHDSMYLT